MKDSDTGRADPALLRPIDRDGLHALGDRDGLLPLWLAETVFAPPACVTQALAARTACGFLGYTALPDSLYQALAGWMARRHGWDVSRASVVFGPNVVLALQAALRATVPEGGRVIVQTPAHPAFATAIGTLGRQLIANPLVEADLRYGLDLEHLEDCARQGAGAILFCSPHNPVGRVWREAELRGVLEIARRHGLAVIADEVHADLALPGARHTPFGRLAAPGDRVVTLVSPGKTFGLQGLGLAAAIVSEPALRERIAGAIEAFSGTFANPLSIVAAEAAYTGGDAWLDALLACIDTNRQLAVGRLAMPGCALRAARPEGTYLLWLDGRGLPDTGPALTERFATGGATIKPGSDYGPAWRGFGRISLGVPTGRLRAVLDRVVADASAGS